MKSSDARPRKILHVLNGAGGGAALSTIGLIEAMRAHGIDSCAVCHDSGSNEERNQLRDASRDQVLFTNLYWWNKKIRTDLWKRPLIEARQILRTGWTRRSASRVAEFATRFKVDLIHTNTIVIPEGGLAARALALPHVWHLRELVGRGMPFRLALEGHTLGKYLISRCSKLVANSHVTAAHVRDWVPKGLLAIIPNGIDVGRFSPRPRPSVTRPIIVAMVGSLTSRWKKHRLLVEAASRVDPCLPIEWRIYGHDPSNGGRKRGDDYVDGLHARLRRHRLHDRFNWPGFVADPVTIMSEIDILVHPADNESFGRVVVEAMAAGIPVVGVRGGGVGELVRHDYTGLLATVDSAYEIASHVEKLARNPDLRDELGQNGRARALSEYTLEEHSRRMLEVYQWSMEHPLNPK